LISLSQPYTASEGQASNLRRHLWSEHGLADAAFKSQMIQSTRVTRDNPSLPPLSKVRREQLDTALLNCIVDDGLPFTTFSKPGMANLLTTFEPNYRPPDRHTLSDRVTDIYEAYISDLKVSTTLVFLENRHSVSSTSCRIEKNKFLANEILSKGKNDLCLLKLQSGVSKKKHVEEFLLQ
jgi:hypothetical protein